jgi:small subunit ribosomal protein S1
VTKVVAFGAFVEIVPGVEGLVHISELAEHHVETPGEVVQPGEEVRVKILEIDEERRRISLSIKRVGEGGMPLRDAFAQAQADAAQTGGEEVAAPEPPVEAEQGVEPVETEPAAAPEQAVEAEPAADAEQVEEAPETPQAPEVEAEEIAEPAAEAPAEQAEVPAPELGLSEEVFAEEPPAEEPAEDDAT